MALGCPVTESGPMPGTPDPARGQMAVEDGIDLVGADVDWLTPWLNTVTVRSRRGHTAS